MKNFIVGITCFSYWLDTAIKAAQPGESWFWALACLLCAAVSLYVVMTEK